MSTAASWWREAGVLGETTLTSLIAGERNQDSATGSYLVVQNQWNYTIWDHADTSPIAVSAGVPALLGKIWCTEAFAGTPAPIIQDGASNILWTVDTGLALAATITVMEGTRCVTDLRVVNGVAGTAGKLVIQWRPL